jgi:hypothetical protein
MGAMCPCGGRMVPNRRWMVPSVSCMQHIGATGTMWEPDGNCVGCVEGGWCHAPSAGYMGTVCSVWEVDGLWEPFGSILEADGNTCELNAPYGGHMRAVCLPYVSCVRAMWKPLHHMGAKMVPTVRQICELYALSGSHVRCMGAVGAVWEPYGSPVGHTGGGCHHMGARCAT